MKRLDAIQARAKLILSDATRHPGIIDAIESLIDDAHEAGVQDEFDRLSGQSVIIGVIRKKKSDDLLREIEKESRTYAIQAQKFDEEE
jgi:hypothetical protein